MVIITKNTSVLGLPTILQNPSTDRKKNSQHKNKIQELLFDNFLLLYLGSRRFLASLAFGNLKPSIWIIPKICSLSCGNIAFKFTRNLLFFYLITYRKITPIKWMDNKGLIAQMYNTRDSITCLERSHGSRNKLTAREVFDRSVVIAMLYVLLRHWDSSFFEKFSLPNIGCKQSPRDNNKTPM